MKNIFDVIIIGAGPAGITAAIYAKRAGLNIKLFEKYIPGGQVVNAFEIENYPGFSKINGFELALNFQEQLKHLNIEITSHEVNHINKLEDNTFELKTLQNETFFAKKVILAIGSQPRKLGVNLEDKYMGRGVSYCATCDGSFYKDKDVVVVGGGNSAITEALYLAGIARNVTVLARNVLRASDHDIKKLEAKDNVTITLHSSIKEIIEKDNKLVGINIINNETKEEHIENIDGIFVYVGSFAPTAFVEELGILKPNGYIDVHSNFETNIDGLYAIGDSIDKKVRQIVTAQSDAAIAVSDILENI